MTFSHVTANLGATGGSTVNVVMLSAGNAGIISQIALSFSGLLAVGENLRVAIQDTGLTTNYLFFRGYNVGGAGVLPFSMGLVFPNTQIQFAAGFALVIASTMAGSVGAAQAAVDYYQ
jgi:hypothetical protein